MVSKVSTWAKTFSIGFVTNFIYCARRFTSANCKKSFVTYLLTLYTILEFGCAQIFVSRCITHLVAFCFFKGLLQLVYDQNLVSVSATETKIKSRYRFPGQNFFCLNLNFLPFWNIPKIQFSYDLKDKEQHLDSQDYTDI